MVALVKKVVIWSAYYFGFFKLLRFLNRDKVTIMTIHGVMEDLPGCTWVPLRTHLPPSSLDKMLGWMASRYTFIPLSRAMDILEGKAPPVKNGLALTFDDGYRNNITHALPILKKYGVVPTFFIATSYLDEQKPFWFEHLDFSLQEAKVNGIKVEFLGADIEFDNSSRDTLTRDYSNFRSDCKAKFENDEQMLEEFSSLAEKLESMGERKLRDIMSVDEWAGVMSWEELSEVVASGDVEVGSHTLDHYRLDCLSEDEIRRQLRESKTLIERKLGIDCQTFCYPNGNFNDVATRLVKEEGYRAAFTTMYGLCSKGDNRVELTRVNFAVTESVPLFSYLLSGFAKG